MEQLRELIAIPIEKKFNKALFGFEKKDVLDYINQLEANQKNSVSNYEKKLSEQNNSLTMALREVDTLTEKVSELKKQVENLSCDVDESNAKLIAENHMLKRQITTLTELEKKNEELMRQLTDLNAKNEFIQSERQILVDSLKEKEETILELCKSNAEVEKNLKSEIEKIKIAHDSERKVQLLNIQNAKDSLTKLLTIVDKL